MPRLILLFFNAVAFGFLIHRMLRIYDQVPAGPKKNVMIATGIILLLLPVAMIMGFIKPTLVYLVIYPIGIGMFIYFVRLRD